MRIPALFPLLLTQLLSFASGAQTAEIQTPVYRVDVHVVQVDAQVLSKKTRHAARELKKEDFELYEDNVRQQVSSFSQDTLPLSVVLLFDLTDSVRPVLKSLADGALEALQHLKPEDEVTVMVYAASAQVLQEATTDRALAVAAIEKASRMESGEAAFFNEGIFQAAEQLTKGKNPSSRRVIIWLTDDVPNIPSEGFRPAALPHEPEWRNATQPGRGHAASFANQHGSVFAGETKRPLRERRVRTDVQTGGAHAPSSGRSLQICQRHRRPGD